MSITSECLIVFQYHKWTFYHVSIMFDLEKELLLMIDQIKLAFKTIRDKDNITYKKLDITV